MESDKKNISLEELDDLKRAVDGDPLVMSEGARVVFRQAANAGILAPYRRPDVSNDPLEGPMLGIFAQPPEKVD